MRICFVLPPIERYSPLSGGAIATCVMQVARGLIERGHDVAVLADNHGDDPYEVGRYVPICYPHGERWSLCRRGVSKARCRLHQYDWPRYDRYLRSVCQAVRTQRLNPDVIVTANDLHAPRRFKQAFPATRQVLWLHNEQGTRHAQPRRLLRHVDHIVTNSDYIRRYTRQRYHLPAAKISVVHNGVDLDAFYPRVDYQAPRSPVRVLYLGRIDPNKGVDLAVDAVAALREAGHAVEMTVAGGQWFFENEAAKSDPYLDSLKQKMQRAEARYLGHVPRSEVPSVLREHDIVCVLSRSQEPFGLVALEAMASGCAVIASDRGGLPEACGGAAVVVPGPDFNQTKQVLAETVTNETVLMNAKRNAVARGRMSSWSVAGGRFENVLLQMHNTQNGIISSRQMTEAPV